MHLQETCTAIFKRDVKIDGKKARKRRKKGRKKREQGEKSAGKER
jgi:hypothetical protein